MFLINKYEIEKLITIHIMKGDEFLPFFCEQTMELCINEFQVFQFLEDFLKPNVKKSDFVENKPKSDIEKFKRGHRKKMFTEKQVEEIKYKYSHCNATKTQLAKEYHCSPKTIYNVLKLHNNKEC